MSADTALETLVACPLCGEPGAAPLLTGRDLMHRLPGQFPLMRCQGCGLRYQNPRPGPAAIAAFYPDSYGSYASASAGLSARRGLAGALVRRAQFGRVRRLERAVAALPSQPRRLLDIGCASGLFLEAAQRRGWAVAGVELNVRAAEAVSVRLGVPVFAGPFERARYPDAAFDAVTLWDVLEHLHDPLAALREVRRVLRPGGALFVRVPNAASYVARLCGGYWSGYDLPRHLTHFTPRTLARALRAAGFIELVTLYGSGSTIGALHSLRFWLDDGRLPPGQAAALHRALSHPALRAVLLPPTALADRLLGGSNLEVLVR